MAQRRQTPHPVIWPWLAVGLYLVVAALREAFEWGGWVGVTGAGILLILTVYAALQHARGRDAILLAALLAVSSCSGLPQGSPFDGDSEGLITVIVENHAHTGQATVYLLHSPRSSSRSILGRCTSSQTCEFALSGADLRRAHEDEHVTIAYRKQAERRRGGASGSYQWQRSVSLNGACRVRVTIEDHDHLSSLTPVRGGCK